MAIITTLTAQAELYEKGTPPPKKKARADIPDYFFQKHVIDQKENLFNDLPLQAAFSVFSIPREVSTYIIANETNRQSLIDRIPLNADLVANNLHIGFSCDVNFDLIARRKPAYAIIADIDPAMFGAYQIIKKTLALVKSRHEFVDQLLSDKKIQDALGICGLDKELWKTGYLSAKFYYLLNQRFSWLGSDESFDFVKNFFQQDRCHFVNLNILNIDDIKKVARWYESKGLRVDSIYLSNIQEWINKEQTFRYRDNINLLIKSPDTFIIDAKYPKEDRRIDSGPPLRVSQGRLLID
ncbi:MAG: hypothetical protein K1060chlam5_01119 [Candidatus Anoxychlamydiales bacterium]|nr:hypothetical protein [Candidatus Anoxychlamydiales bacterium]